MKPLYRPQFGADIYRESLWLMDNASLDVAERWNESVKRAVKFLTKNPQLGRERKDIEFPGIRSWGARLPPMDFILRTTW